MIGIIFLAATASLGWLTFRLCRSIDERSR